MDALTQEQGRKLGLRSNQPSDPGNFSKVLGKLASRYPDYFPGESRAPSVSKIDLDRRRHSDVARVELDFSGSKTRVYVKLHKKPKRRPHTPLEAVRGFAQREFDLLTLQHQNFRSVPRCFVARPIAFFPEEMAVVTEEAEGENLHRLIKKKAALWHSAADLAKLQDHCVATGVWLSHFQRFARQARLRPMAVDFLVAEFKSDLKISLQMGLPAACAKQALEFFEERLRRVGAQPMPVVGEHPDFQPDNILVSTKGITVLDFTNFRYGTRYNDLARFLVSLDFLCKNPLYRPHTIRALMAAFLRGYGWEPGESDSVLIAYLLRCMAQTVATVSTWPYPSLLKPLMVRQTINYFAAWCWALINVGDAYIETLIR